MSSVTLTGSRRAYPGNGARFDCALVYFLRGLSASFQAAIPSAMSLIREIRLPNGRLTKNLGFGCAGLLRLPTQWQREKLLRTALDAGITHFDVARMYGAGAAEGILGSCLKGRLDRATVATKFGFPCGVPTRRQVAIQSAARWVANWHPAVKKILKRSSAPAGDRHYDYSVGEMERSLATSLKELRVERLDLFFIHEPRAADRVPEDLGEALRLLKKKGDIGAFGLSALPDDLAYFFRERPELRGEAVQYPFLRADASLPPIPAEMYAGAFHVLAGPLGVVAQHVERDTSFARTWSEKLGLDLRRRESLALSLLAVSLNARPEGMTLFFTSKASRIRQITKGLASHSFTSEVLSALRLELVRIIAANHAM